MSGSLSSLPAAQQIEALYIAYFGRAADAGGYVYWFNQYTTLTGAAFGGGQGGASTQVVVNMAESFGVQTEAKGLYSFLATPPAIPIADPSNPPSDVQFSVDTFLTAAYQNMFSRAPDAAGEAYWSTQILSGAISVGAAIFDIANGAAVGSIDARVLAYKVEAANFFTTQAAPVTPGITPAFLAAAHAAVASVVGAASLAAAEAAMLSQIKPGGVPTSTVSATGGNVASGSATAGASDVTLPVASLTSVYTASGHVGA